jgi:hypothetical protein
MKARVAPRAGFPILALALAALLHGCGAPSADRAPAKAPAGAGGEAPAGPIEEKPAPPPAPPADVDNDGVPDTAGRGSVSAAMVHARSDLDRAERELRTAAGDCATACRALGSMERATAHLCSLATAPEDRDHCEHAKARVIAARAEVKSTCGSCAGGPSVDRDAPIPSR